MLAFITGVLTGHYIAPSDTVVLIILGFSLAGIAAGLYRRWRSLPILLILTTWLALGTLSYQVRYHRCAEDNIIRYSANKPVLVRLRADVLEDGKWVDSNSPWPSDPSLYLSVKVTTIHTQQGWISADGILRVRVRRPSRSIVRGEQLEMLGMLSRYRGPQNPGEFDWRRYNRFQDRLCRLTVDNGQVLRPLKQTTVPSSPGLITRFRQHFSAVLSNENFSDQSSSLLKAMVLGERDATFGRLNEAFQKTGLFHFLCVSGLHLGILAGFVWFVGLIVGLPRRASALLVMATIILYALLVPARAPVIRASIVICLLCLAEISGRKARGLHTLALAALMILLWRPAEIFNIGFQLSFIIVAALITLAPRITRLLLRGQTVTWVTDPGTHPRPIVKQVRRWPWFWFIKLFSICLIAWFAAAPLVVYYFGLFNPWTPVYSTLMAPLAVATIVSGYVTVVLGSAFPLLANSLQNISLSLADLFFRAATALAKIPGIIQQLPAPPVMLMVAFYALLILVAVRPRLQRRYGSSLLARAWLIPPFLALVAVYLWCSGPTRPADILAFHLLAVGNGQASVVELPNGGTLAYDAGNMSGADLASRTIMPFLRTRHLRKLDALMISHPNWDHYSAATELIKATEIPTLIVSPYFQDDPQRKQLSEMFRAGAASAIVGESACLTNTGTAQIEILWPPHDTTLVQNLKSNDSSLVIRISYAGRRILLTGDISATTQGLLLASGTDLQADVLVWPHHGAIVNTTESFFKAVDPKIILVSCDAQRAKKIREQKFSPLLAERVCYTTSESGAISILLGKKGIKVIPFIQTE